MFKWEILFWNSIREVCLQINWLHNIAPQNSKKRTCMENIIHFPLWVLEHKSIQNQFNPYIAGLVSLFIHCRWTRAPCRRFVRARGEPGNEARIVFTVHSLWMDTHRVLPEDVEGTICLPGTLPSCCSCEFFEVEEVPPLSAKQLLTNSQKRLKLSPQGFMVKQWGGRQPQSLHLSLSTGCTQLMCTWWVIVLLQLPKKHLEPLRVNPASWSLSLSSLMTWSHALLISDVSSSGSKWLDLLFFLDPAKDTSEISSLGLHVIREDNAVVTTLTV